MAITNAKNSYMTRLFGTAAERDKEKYIQARENPTPSTAINNPTANKIPAFMQAREQEAEPAPAPAQSQQSRYNLMQMVQPEPTRDAEQEEILKKRAKMNAFGKGISALAGLAGVAMGGDAPVVPDTVTPWNMQQSQLLDQDYRNRLQDWTGRQFQVDAANNQIANREIDQTIDNENAMERVKLLGQNAQELAQQRAQQELQKLQTQSLQKQREAMTEVGIDPNDPEAYGKYLQQMSSQYSAEMNSVKARTSAYNRSNTGAEGASKGMQQPIAVYQAKQKAKLAQIDAQLAEIDAMEMPQTQKEAAKAALIEEKSFWSSKYNPGTNELADAEILELGGIGAGAEAKEGRTESNVRFDPSKGFTNTSGKQDPGVTARIKSSLPRVVSQEIEEEEIAQLVQDLIESGEAEDEDEALDLLQKYKKQFSTKN